LLRFFLIEINPPHCLHDSTLWTAGRARMPIGIGMRPAFDRPAALCDGRSRPGGATVIDSNWYSDVLGVAIGLPPLEIAL